MNNINDITLKKLINIGLIIIIYASSLLILEYLGFFKLLRTILIALIPVILAIFVAFLVEPLIQFFMRHKIKRPLSVLLTYALFAIALALLGSLLIPNIIHQVITFIHNLPSIISTITKFLDGLSDDYGIHIDFTVLINGYISKYTSDAFSSIVNIFSSIINVTLVVGGSLFLSFDFDRFKKWIKRAIPQHLKRGVGAFFQEYLMMIHRYVFGILLDALVIWILSTIGFLIIGLDYPLVFGLVVASFDLVPIIGPYLGGTPAVLVGLTTSFEMALLVILVLIIIQTIDGNFIQPYIIKNVIYIHPLESILGLSVLGAIFGFWGMVSSPLVIMAIKIIAKQIKEAQKQKEVQFIDVKETP